MDLAGASDRAVHKVARTREGSSRDHQRVIKLIKFDIRILMFFLAARVFESSFDRSGATPKSNPHEFSFNDSESSRFDTFLEGGKGHGF